MSQQLLAALHPLLVRLATALPARLAVTDGRVLELVTPPLAAGPQTAPVYDAQADRLVWPEATGCTQRTVLWLPDGRPRTLWALWPEQACGDLEAVAALCAQWCQAQQEKDDLTTRMQATREEISLFYELAETLGGAREEAQLCERLLQQALLATTAQGGMVLLPRAEGLAVMAAQGEVCASLRERPVAVFPVLESALQRGLTYNVGAMPEGQQPDRPTIIAPILIQRRPEGALVLQKQAAAPFSAGEAKMVQSLGTYAGVFLHNLRQARRLVEAERLRQQLALAEALQRQLLPAADVEVAGLEVGVAYLTSNRVGGDYYDLLPLGPRRVGAVIADVSGHSIASGLLMTSVRSALRLLCRYTTQPAQILRQLNDALYRDLDQTGQFISVCLVLLDLEAHRLCYASAGHHPALLYRQASGEVVPLAATGFVLGFVAEATFDERELPFAAGDALVLYTDGVPEARGPAGTRFGDERLRACVAAVGPRRARDAVGAILAEVRRHSQEHLDDDVTLVVLKADE
ncbi:MAG: hypothetical protein KatS3mg131_1526 [Candidatus Tectimicrobiota bacterium]|nr:MAG: hypothetical protein KatS3mg131_1526 [Candidatus Tectomicrobia bacterium]